MGAWDLYEARMGVVGPQKRDMVVKHTQSSLTRRIVDSVAYKQVDIDGVPQSVGVINKTNLSIKVICALPGEHIPHGGLVDFADNKWMITELDANNEIYERGLMKQCNHILRWINSDGRLIEKWCIVEDGTKYLIGEHSEEMMTVGDARIAITLRRDEDSIAIKRGRRFLIDDPGSSIPTAYQVTKLNKLFNVYNDAGVFRFILTEDALTKYDNRELRIADYYNWAPVPRLDSDHRETGETIDDIVINSSTQSESPLDDDKGVWL